MPSNTELPDRPDPSLLHRWLARFSVDRWVVGFSGGADSTALLHLLARIPNRPDLLAVHVHHGLQTEADHWTRFCQQQCRRLDIELIIHPVQVVERGLGLEAAARQARYQALEQHLRAGDALLLAHHGDDLAETLLLNLFRGAGLHGMSAMPPARRLKQGWLLRPLLGLRRSQLLQWLESQLLQWQEDPSNQDDRFSRNFLRNRCLPLLDQRWPGVRKRLADTALLLQQQRDLLDAFTRSSLATMRLENGGLQRDTLATLSPQLQREVLRLWLHETTDHVPTRRKLEEIRRAALSDQRRFTIPWQNHRLCGWHDGLFALPRCQPEPGWQQSWDGLHALQLPDGCGMLSLHPPAGWTDPPMQVRLRQGGERLRLPGRRHHHALKKLLQATRTPPWERDCLPILQAGDGEILAAGDRWISQRMQTWLEERGSRLRWQRPWQPRTMRSTSHGDLS